MNKQDLTLLTDLYELTMMQGYYKKGNMRRLYSMCFTVTIPAAMVIPSARDLTRSLTILRT